MITDSPTRPWRDPAVRRPPYGTIVEGEMSDGSVRPVYLTRSDKWVFGRGPLAKGLKTKDVEVVRWRRRMA
jgi:hypothetical protein